MNARLFLSGIAAGFLIFFSPCINLRAQSYTPAVSKDTAAYPYWIKMMQDPDANYFSTVSAFEKYWKDRPIVKGCGWKVFKRWEYIMKGRISPDGKKPAPDAVSREWIKNRQSNRSPNGTWTSLGPSVIPSPGPAGYLGLGRLNVVAFHPTDQNKIFAGSPSGGFWLSGDNGANWTTTTDNMPTIGVSAIAVDYSNPSVILMGTGDRDHGDAPGMGVYKSTDGGFTWNPSKTGMDNVTVSKLIQHPGNALIYLAATTSGVFRSVNGGASWSLTWSADVKDICFNPGNPDIVYAESSADFYRSANNGLTFTQVTSGLIPGQRGAIAVSPDNPGYVYFLQSDFNSGFQGVYRSTDSGLNFSTRSTSPNLLGWSCDGDDSGGQGWYDLVITADPADAEIIYVGGVDVWKSTNGGSTWAINSHWYGGCNVPAVHADCHFLGYSPANGRLYAGNDGGVYYTADGGTSWTDCTVGMTIGQIYKIGQSLTDVTKTINGFQDNGTYTSTSSGWVATGGGDGMECAVDWQNASYTYHTIYFGSIYRKVNNSSEFQVAGNGLFGIDESGGWVTPFILSEDNPKQMFVGYKNVWRCGDVTSGSPSWTKISSGETDDCSVLEQSPASTSLLYVVRWGTMQRTENANDLSPSWIACTLPGGYTPSDLEAHPTEPNTVYATAGYRVYKSTDMGDTWSLVPGTLPDIPVNTIVYEKNSNEGLYIGTQTGVLYRNAALSGWVNFSSGFPVVDVRELEIFYGSGSAGNRIFAATFGRGLWRSDLYSPPQSPPLAGFSYSPTQVCASEEIHFTDLSLNLPTSWLWSVIPTTITFVNSTTPLSRNPQILFTENRSYTVTLTATNAFGSSSSNTVIMIGGTVPPVNETFDSGMYPEGWTILNPDNSYTWYIADAGASGTKSSAIYFFDYNAPGQTDDLILPSINLKTALNPLLLFNVAYRRWGQGYSDGMKIFISTDCGTTWESTPIYDKSGTDLATGPDQGYPFVPAEPGDWRLDSVDLKNYAGMSVRLKFQGICGWGNNLYIDDVTIAEQPAINIRNLIVGSGQYDCYNASQTIRVGGNETPFAVMAGGHATFIAGQNIIFQEGTTVEEGAYLHGYITATGPYCGTAPASMVTAGYAGETPSKAPSAGIFSFYPNPNNGYLVIERSQEDSQGSCSIEVYGLPGDLKLKSENRIGRTVGLDVSSLPPGLYLLRVSSKKSAATVKMIRQ